MTEDESIIGMFFARSEQALQETEKRYGKLCRSLALNILGDQRDAEECVNDALLGAWHAIPPARPASLQAYLCKIVRNTALNRRQHQSAAKRDSTHDLALQELEGCLTAPDDVGAAVEAKELAGIIGTFLDQLPQEDRVIFVRRYVFFDRYATIAKQVGMTEKNVSVRLIRIRKRLKEYLAEREVPYGR